MNSGGAVTKRRSKYHVTTQFIDPVSGKRRLVDEMEARAIEVGWITEDDFRTIAERRAGRKRDK